MDEKIKVVELFAGVGGFRLGLEGWKGKSATSNYTEALNGNYKVVWSNQWEPSTKTQHASMVYENRFGKESHSNEDITTVSIEEIPDHDLLVGGFPCQDYSVATTLKNSKGLIGKKGVLWWSIYKILLEKQKKPKYILLENVDRLLISPSKQRGRDFAVMLSSLSQLGYAVEWRVINAADYGMPQRRRRVFILGYLKGTDLYKELSEKEPKKWILNDGVFATAFPSVGENKLFPDSFNLSTDIVEVSKNFNPEKVQRPFENSGIMVDSKVSTIKVTSSYTGSYAVLKDIIINDDIPKEYYIKDEDIERWEYLKGAKKEERKNSNGFKYHYSEGAMVFPDSLDSPSRTIITGEGGESPSRFKHVINTDKGLRRLTPLELERLDMFPDNHTKLEGITDSKRAFFMGNALVVGIVEKIGLGLLEKIYNEVTV